MDRNAADYDRYAAGPDIDDSIDPHCDACGHQLGRFAGPERERGLVCLTPGCERADVDLIEQGRAHDSASAETEANSEHESPAVFHVKNPDGSVLHVEEPGIGAGSDGSVLHVKMVPPDDDAPHDWIFTFGSGHTHPKTGEPLGRRFVRITGTWTGARAQMASVFGMAWSHQYPTEAAAGVGEWGYTELELDWAAAAVTVHLLRGGHPLCDKLGLPGQWGAGHRWVHADSDDHGPRDSANCAECLLRAARLQLAEPLTVDLLDGVSVSRDRAAQHGAALVPDQLREEYLNDEMVRAVFDLAAYNGTPRESALIAIIIVAVPAIREMRAELAKHAQLEEMIEPLSGDEIKDLLRAVLFWRAQGSRKVTSHWTTAPSRNLAEVADRLRAKHPTLCAALAPASLSRPPPRETDEADG